MGVSDEIFLTRGKGNGIHVPVVIDVRITLEHFISTRSCGSGSTFEHSILILVQPKGMTVILLVELENVGPVGGRLEAGEKESHVIFDYTVPIGIVNQSDGNKFMISKVLCITTQGIALKVECLVSGHRT